MTFRLIKFTLTLAKSRRIYSLEKKARKKFKRVSRIQTGEFSFLLVRTNERPEDLLFVTNGPAERLTV